MRLLQCGAFEIMDDLELMSDFKWKKLIRISQIKGCQGIVFDGMIRYTKAQKLKISEPLQTLWMGVITQTETEARQMNNCIVEMYQLMSKKLHYPVLMRGRDMALLYDNPLHYSCDHIDWWIPTEEKAREVDAWAMREANILSNIDKDKLTYTYLDTKVQNNHFVVKLMDKRLNTELQNIVTREKSYYKPFYVEINATNIEIMPSSILLLMLVLNLVQHILMDEVIPIHIIDLGMYLRKRGDKVDYIKIERWLDQLKMQQVADLAGGLLIKLFHFSKDEIPFMKHYDEKIVEAMVHHIFSEDKLSVDEDGLNIARNTRKGINKLMHTASNMKYQPREITSGYLKKMIQALKVEE